MRKVFYGLIFLAVFFGFNLDAKAATLAEGVYTIESAIGSNKVIDVAGGKTADKTNIQLYKSNNTKSQQWYVKPVGDGYYAITSMLDTNKSLDVEGSGKKNGTNVQLYTYYSTTNAQKWYIKDAGNGYYNIISKCNDLYVDVDGGSSANGTNIQMYKGNGTKAQKFKFNRLIEGTKTIEDGVYTISSFSDNTKSISVHGDVKNGGGINLSNTDNGWPQLWRVKYLGNGYYSIMSYLDEHYVLDVAGGSSASGTKLQLYKSNNTKAQKWIIFEQDGYYNIISALDKMYVDIKSGSIVAGNSLQIYRGNDTIAQKFTFNKVDTSQVKDGLYTLNSALDDQKVVSVNSDIAINTANVDLRTNSDKNNQKWYVEYLGDGYYSLKSAIDNKYVLDVQGGSTSSNANVQIYKSNNTEAQKWYLKDAGNGYFYVVAKHSNMYLDVSGGNTADGTNIRVHTSNGTASQKFKLTATSINEDDQVISQPYEDGYYTIASKLNTNKVIDVEGGKKANGTNVQLYDNNGVVAQIWYFKKIEDGYYTITSSMNPETSLTAASSNIVSGTNVYLSKYTGADTQKWIVKDLGDGYVSIISKASGLYVDVTGSSTANKTNIQLYQGADTNAQRFKLVKNEDQKVYTGIDVSHHQNLIDWATVANSDIGFVIIRAGYGGDWTDQDDEQFLNNVAACEKYNIPYGLYLYSYASEIDNSETSAQAEAKHMLRLLTEIEKRDYSPNLGTKVFIDMEDKSVVNAGKDKLTAVSDTFCSQIEANGYSCGIYANKTWLTQHLNTPELAKKYEIWLAEWLDYPNPTHGYAKAHKPTYNLTPYKYWQFASDGKVSGISGNVDMDLGYDIFD